MYELYFDGGANPNPGEGGCGAVIIQNGMELHSTSCYLGNNTTNNVAEYNGLIIGLELAIKHNIKNLIVKMGVIICTLSAHYQYYFQITKLIFLQCTIGTRYLHTYPM